MTIRANSDHWYQTDQSVTIIRSNGDHSDNSWSYYYSDECSWVIILGYAAAQHDKSCKLSVITHYIEVGVFFKVIAIF